MSSTEEFYSIADQLRAIANLGLRYAENHYDKERYERVLSASARLVATLERRTLDEVMAEYEGNLNHVGPIAAADAAVSRDGRLLLIKREDNGLWAMPGGLADVGETLAEAAQRELREETNVRGRAITLLGIFDSRLCHSRTKSHVYHTIFLVDPGDSVPVAGPETTDVGFFSEDDLPDLSPGHHIRVPITFKLISGKLRAPYFDLVEDHP